MATVASSATTTNSSYSMRNQDSVPRMLATEVDDNDRWSARWAAIVDQPLIDWGRKPSCEDEDGLVSPSREAVNKAVSLVNYMRSRSWPLPTGVVADGEGGIAFELRLGVQYQRIEIDDFGQMTLLTFLDCELKSCDSLEISSVN